MKHPSHLIDRMTLAFFSLFAGGLRACVRERQYAENLRAWEEYRNKHKEPMLERQALLSAFSYGKTARLWEKLFLKGRQLTAAENSCEVIAVYNALRALPGGSGADKTSDEAASAAYELPALLRYFSQRGICAHGLFGTSPRALARFFTEQGYQTKVYTGRQITKAAMAALEKECDVCILTSFNRGQNPFHMVHTMCVTKEADGWQLHNDYAGSRVYADLYAAVCGYADGRSHPICVLGVYGGAYSE